ncbi:MAG TPA: protein kinase, partial [Vicinamibacteria bacterium]
LAGDPDVHKRFEREARTISKLSHPHICPLFDVGEQEGLSFLVMEYLEGESLADRLSRGPLPLNEALRYARQIAEALEEAHQHGIVHRDLKPGNVMLTKKGAKLLDFGIAKLRAAVFSEEAPTATASALTGEGLIVGTPQYMAPEQLEGKPVDARTDIFAFGVLLYEMITARKAFEAPSRAAVIAAILERDPPPLSPPALDALVKRCLAKRPADRWQSCADLLGHLEAPLARRRPRPFGVRGALAAILAGVAVIGLVAAGLRLSGQRRAGPTQGLVLKRLTADAGLTTDPALSPDGRLIAYASDRAGNGNLDIWVQQVAGGEPIRLTRHAADESMPDFSPDGTQIAFRSDRDGGGVYLVSALGGEPALIAPQGFNPRFSPDGQWIAYHTGIYGTRSAGIPHFGSGKLYILPVTGGPPRQIQATAKAIDHPIWSPDSRHLLMVASFEVGTEPSAWWITPLEGTATEVIREPLRQQGLRGAHPMAWLTGERIVFSAVSGDTRNSWVATLSPATWQIEGPPARLTSGAGTEGPTTVASATSDILTLAFASITENVDLWSVPVGRDGTQTASQPIRLTQDAFHDATPAMTADGKTLFYASRRDVRARDLVSGRDTKVVSMSPDPLHKPVLSPDGSKLAFWRLENEGRPSAVFVTDLTTAPDGTLRVGSLRQLPALAKEGAGWPWSWSPDGRAIWYDTVRWPRLGPNHLYNVAAGRVEAEFVHPQHDLAFLLVSPDGRWLVFFEPLSDNTARLVATPIRDGKPAEEREWVPITGADSGVYWHAWSPRGDVIYFTSARDGFVCVWAQRVARDTMRLLGAPVAIHHAHSPRLSISAVGPNTRGLAAAGDKVVFNMSEMTGNIWMAELPNGR